MNWISYIKKFLIRNFDLSPASSKSEAVVLKWTLTGKQNIQGNEINLLLQIKPSQGRSYLREYVSYFSQEQSSSFETGQKITIVFDSNKTISRIIFTEVGNQRSHSILGPN